MIHTMGSWSEVVMMISTFLRNVNCLASTDKHFGPEENCTDLGSTFLSAKQIAATVMNCHNPAVSQSIYITACGCSIITYLKSRKTQYSVMRK